MPTFANAFLPDSLVISTALSPDKQTASILLMNLSVELPSREKPTPPARIRVGQSLGDSQLVASRLGNIYFQLKGDEPEATARIVIKGNVSVGAGARALLVSRIAGTTFTDELAVSEKIEEYELTHSVRISPESGLPITLLILVDREFVEGSLSYASAVVDSVDLVFEPPPAPKEVGLPE